MLHGLEDGGVDFEENCKRLAREKYSATELDVGEQAKVYSAELCPDGEAGYRAFLKNKYDLCVLDVMMPKRMDLR